MPAKPTSVATSCARVTRSRNIGQTSSNTNNCDEKVSVVASASFRFDA